MNNLVFLKSVLVNRSVLVYLAKYYDIPFMAHRLIFCAWYHTCYSKDPTFIWHDLYKANKVLYQTRNPDRSFYDKMIIECENKGFFLLHSYRKTFKKRAYKVFIINEAKVNELFAVLENIITIQFKKYSKLILKPNDSLVNNTYSKVQDFINEYESFINNKKYARVYH
jgi:hypothetical protein